MDLFQLETFLAVAREKTFSGAALRLHRTQPAISQTVRKLEESIGEPLFDRSSRNGSLTDAGVVLQEYAEKLLNLRQETHQALSDLRSVRAGRLTIAANEFTSLCLLKVLDEYRRLHPMVSITVQRAFASRISHDLLNHQIELGMLSFNPNEPRLRSIVVFRDELAFVVHPKHPLALHRQLSIQQLGTETFIAHNVPSPYRAKVLETFRKYKTPLNMEIELPSLEGIRKVVALGIGVALLPRISVESEIERGDLVQIPIKELKVERRLRVVYRRNAPLSHAAKAFLKLIEKRSQDKKSGFLFQKE
jgi:DNA-binding transcriptional LysR family regulator